jgi:hypothetical protein
MKTGDVYNGYFKNGKFDGNGTYIKSKSLVKYEGGYLNGLKHGLGRITENQNRII